MHELVSVYLLWLLGFVVLINVVALRRVRLVYWDG